MVLNLLSLQAALSKVTTTKIVSNSVIIVRISIGTSSKDTKPFVTSITEEIFKICGEDFAMRRVFIHASDSGLYFRVGWLLTQDVPKCLVCCVEFGMILMYCS